MSGELEARALLAVGAGGAIGSMARVGLGRLLEAQLATLAANLSGAFLFGLIAAALVTRLPHRRLTLFLTTGVLGGYTTFSTFMVETLAGETVAMIGYVAATLAGGMVAVAAGAWLGRRFAP